MSKLISSEFDRNVIQVLRCLVPDQSMKLQAIEGNVWESSCTQADEATSITTIKRNGEVVAKLYYNYHTGNETEELY